MRASVFRRLRLSILLAVGAALVVVAGPVSAISNGVPDGEGHPNVGALLADFSGDGVITGDESFCSGSLIAPTVFLTAGHCVQFLEPAGFSTIYVSFDAALLDANGPGTLIASTTWAFDPAFYTNFQAAHDIGVVILDSGATSGIVPVVLPSAGQLDAMQASGELRSVLIENVGYGVIPGHRGGPTTYAYDGNRNFSLSPVIGLTKTWLKLQMTSYATGLGGVCFGDSGSPRFIQGEPVIVAITTGGNGQCIGANYNYRLDTADARAFLDDFVTLP